MSGSALNVDPSRFKGLEFKSVSDVQSFFSRLTVKEVRAMLQSQGVPQATLDAMSDDDLKKLLETSVDTAASSGALDQLLKPVTDSSSTIPETPTPTP